MKMGVCKKGKGRFKRAYPSTIILLSFLTIIFILFNSEALACVGARALALGGAFTGVADDSQTTYWNPAGLAIAAPGIITMHNINHRHEFNYDDYVGMSYSRKDWGVGFEYIKTSNQKEGMFIKRGKSCQLGTMNQEATWLQFGVAHTFSNLSLGINIRYVEKWREITGGAQSPDVYEKVMDSGFAYDMGAFMAFGPEYKKYKKHMFSAGLLVQDMNKPGLIGQKNIINFRPGMGFRPLHNLLFSVEIYDAAKQYFDQPQLRIGSELVVSSRRFTGEIALRGGVYHVNDESYRALTGGIGYTYPLSKKGRIGLDYAFMRWYQAKKVTHLVSLVYQF